MVFYVNMQAFSKSSTSDRLSLMLLSEVLFTGGSGVLKDVPTTLSFHKLRFRYISVGYIHAIYTTVQKFGQVFFFHFFKEMNTFIQQGCIRLIKIDSKDIYCYKN